MAINFRSWGTERLALAVCALAVVSALWLGVRTFRSFELLQSAYAAGASQTSSIRGWMTLDYVAAAYRLAGLELIVALGLPPETDPAISIKQLADQTQVSPLQYVQKVQRAIGERSVGGATARDGAGWFAALGDKTLTALLVYGYPVLGLTLLLGAVGLPLPDGIAATVVGSLAAQGRMNWAWAAALAVAASVLGDTIGFALGRMLDREVLRRRGGWFGFTTARYVRVRGLFERWGSLTVFVTRTFVSYLSSVANLFAGMSGYRLGKFIAIAAVGRVLWTAAYMGLGYAIGADWEAATSFLANLSLLMLSLIVLAGSALIAAGKAAIPDSAAEEDVSRR